MHVCVVGMQLVGIHACDLTSTTAFLRVTADLPWDIQAAFQSSSAARLEIIGSRGGSLATWLFMLHSRILRCVQMQFPSTDTMISLTSDFFVI